MATYIELFALRANDTLRNRITVACTIAANAIRNEAEATTNHANRLLWAKAVFVNPDAEGQRMLWAVLAQNAAVTTAQILNASDETVQAAVNAAVNVFATGD